MTPVKDLADRVRSAVRSYQPDDDPMGDFDERDLLRFAEDAGFREVHLDYRAEISPGDPPGWKTRAWDIMVRAAPNPLVPSLEKVVDETLTSPRKPSDLCRTSSRW